MMHSLWFLPAVLLAVPFTVWWFRRARMRKFCNRLQSVTQPSVPLGIVLKSAKRQTRQMKCISPDEFLWLLKKCRDLIVIDLSLKAPSAPVPVTTALVIPVGPGELEHVLEWLPADRPVVFCGASGLLIFMIETSPRMRGAAPLYVLADGLHFAEVA